ncbi:MAG: antifreeze protein [Pseudomonadota bacterium]
MLPGLSPATALSLWRLGVETSALVLEAQSVVAMRMLGFAGLWRMHSNEPLRMVVEKPAAFFNSAGEVANATLAGKPPEQVAAAALKPYRRKTRSNSRRLSRR